jgi:hypothetical protein
MKTNRFIGKRIREVAMLIVAAALFATTGAQAGTNELATISVVPVGANFPISQNTGPDAVGGKPGIAFDGVNFLVPYFQGANIYARRISVTGVVLDSTAISISVGNNQSVAAPSVGFDGTNYLVAWVASRSGVYELYGARISPAGVVLDPGGLKITTGGNPKFRMPGIAFDGMNYLMVWRTESDQIYAARVSSNLAILDSPGGFQITGGGAYYPSAAFDGTNFLVVWHDSRNAVSEWDIYGARVTPQGGVLDPGGFVICDDPQNQEHSTVGFDGANYLVAWYDWRPNNDSIFGSVYGARVSPAGVVLDKPSFQIADRARGQVAPKVVCGGGDCMVIWNTDYPNVGTKFRLSDAWGRRISKDGTILDPQGIPVATAFAHQFGAIAGYGGGRYLVAWSDGREINSSIYGQILKRQTSAKSDVDEPVAVRMENAGLANAGWTAESAPVAAYAGGGIAFSAGNSYAFGVHQALHYKTGIWYSEDMFSQGYPYGSWASGPDDIWVSGWCGGFSHYDGQTWTDLGCNSGSGAHIATGVWGSSPTNLWASAIGGKLLRYNGVPNWDTIESGLPYDLTDIWGTSANNIYTVGERGAILRYNGTTWNLQANIPTLQRLNAIWGNAPNNIYAVGDWGTIIHFDGTSWSAMNSGTTQHLYDVWGLTGSDVYAVGFGGTILNFNGTAWVAENSGVTMDLLGVWGVRSGNNVIFWTSGSGSQILKRVKNLPILNKTFFSAGLSDGWILESSETSNAGGLMDSTAATLRLGDNTQKKQFRSILSFNTASLPDTAVITKVTLKLKHSSVQPAGTNPINLMQGIFVDLKKGFFGTNANLQLPDFNAFASKTVGPFKPALTAGWYTLNIPAVGFASVNKTAASGGLTQIRLRFKLDDNSNAIANLLNLVSGNNATQTNRPMLTVEYYLP